MVVLFVALYGQVVGCCFTMYVVSFCCTFPATVVCWLYVVVYIVQPIYDGVQSNSKLLGICNG